MITFDWPDVWILYSILPAIVVRATAGHRPPTKDEVESPLTKGLHVGLLARSPSGVKYADQYREAVRRIVEKALYPVDGFEALGKFLFQHSWERISEDVFSLTDDEIRNAMSFTSLDMQSKHNRTIHP